MKPSEVLVEHLKYIFSISPSPAISGILAMPALASLPFIESLTIDKLPWVYMSGFIFFSYVFIYSNILLKIILVFIVMSVNFQVGAILGIFTAFLIIQAIFVGLYSATYRLCSSGLPDIIFLFMLAIITVIFCSAFKFVPTSYAGWAIGSLLFSAFFLSIPSIQKKSAVAGTAMYAAAALISILVFVMSLETGTVAYTFHRVVTWDWMTFSTIDKKDYLLMMKSKQAAEWREYVKRNIASGKYYDIARNPEANDPTTIYNEYMANQGGDQSFGEYDDPGENQPATSRPYEPPYASSTTGIEYSWMETATWVWKPFKDDSMSVFSILEATLWLAKVFALCAIFITDVMTQYVGKHEIMPRSETTNMVSEPSMDLARVPNLNDYAVTAMTRMIGIPLFLSIMLESIISSACHHGLKSCNFVLLVLFFSFLAYKCWMWLFFSSWWSAGLNRVSSLRRMHPNGSLYAGPNNYACLSWKTRLSYAVSLVAFTLMKFLYAEATGSFETAFFGRGFENIVNLCTAITAVIFLVDNSGTILTSQVKRSLSLVILYHCECYYTFIALFALKAVGLDLFQWFSIAEDCYYGEDRTIVHFSAS